MPPRVIAETSSESDVHLVRYPANGYIACCSCDLLRNTMEFEREIGEPSPTRFTSRSRSKMITHLETHLAFTSKVPDKVIPNLRVGQMIYGDDLTTM